MLDVSIQTLIIALIVILALVFFLRGLAMPKSFGENQEEREKLKQKIRETEQERLADVGEENDDLDEAQEGAS